LLPKDVLDEISWMPQHPDEIFNTTMFTLISIEKALMEWNEETKNKTNILFAISSGNFS